MIDARGRVVSPRAVDVAAPDIAAAVVTAAAQRLFGPPTSGGRPCATPTQLRVAF
ncbi:hypothetical protein [Opitutus sp. ER46]|uniref:hypothetical protein n=1 Tax=Opitutus sp. ER46 TaxID=2161864 RepID=UPI001304A46B|nr:hypothetical protein [Opitutus sp. ER46]